MDAKKKVELQGQVLTVTGGASGIGLACALLWQQYGGKATILDIEPYLDRDSDLIAIRADVTSESQVSDALAAIYKRCGRIDAVFHNAGFLGCKQELEEIHLDEWGALLNVHLTGGLIVSKHALPYIRKAGGGALIFNTSIVGLTGSPWHLGYAAAKAGLISLTLSLAQALGRYRVRVNAVCPGSVVGTGFLERARGHGVTPAELALLVAQIPLGRAATPHDIAEAVCFLASPLAAHITGAVLPVDGGERLGR